MLLVSTLMQAKLGAEYGMFVNITAGIKLLQTCHGYVCGSSPDDSAALACEGIRHKDAPGACQALEQRIDKLLIVQLTVRWAYFLLKAFVHSPKHRSVSLVLLVRRTV